MLVRYAMGLVAETQDYLLFPGSSWRGGGIFSSGADNFNLGFLSAATFYATALPWKNSFHFTAYSKQSPFQHKEKYIKRK